MSETSLVSFTPERGSHLLVVGGCGGMGRSLVQLALELGLRVAVLDIERSIAAFPPPDGVLAIACDVTQEQAVQAAFERVRAEWASSMPA